MSLCVSVVTPEGIIIAGESRQTQLVFGVNRIGTDSATKVFDLTKTTVAATTGWGFIQPEGDNRPRNISSLVEDFKTTIPKDSSVQQIAHLFWTYFNKIYEQHIIKHPNEKVQPEQTALNFAVAGYNLNSRMGELFSIDIPSIEAPVTPSRSAINSGSWWIGQVDVCARIINGYDFRALNLPFVRECNKTGDAKKQLDGLSYMVNWNLMTIQDAIDFAVGMIEITIIIQKFTAGIATQISVAGVGGPIDVAVVQPGKDVIWISRKELHK